METVNFDIKNSDNITLTPSHDNNVYTLNDDGHCTWYNNDSISYGLSDDYNVPSGNIVLTSTTNKNDSTQLVSKAVKIEKKLIKLKVLIYKFENNLQDSNLYAKIEKILYRLINMNDHYILEEYQIKNDSEVIHLANMLKTYWKIVQGEMRMNNEWDKINTHILELIDLINE